MKKLIYLMTLCCAFLAVSCSDEDEKEKLSQVVVSLSGNDVTIDSYEGFTLTVTDKKSGTSTVLPFDATGKVVIDKLALGQYDFTAEQKIQGVTTLFGQKLNETISQEMTNITLVVESAISKLDKTFVLDELYFNGDKEGWNSFYYESYLTIRNISSVPLFADGLSIAICGDYNSIDANEEMSAYLNDNIIISQLYTIPMVNGQHVVVEPGKSLVLAHSAINHKAATNSENSVDLSGADFEFYVQYIENGEDYTMTADNAEVPNMIVDYSANQSFNWGYTGATPIMLVRLDDATKTSILSKKINMTMPMSYGYMKLDYVSLPASAVIDGVETGAKDAFLRKVLPNAIDRGSIQVETGYGFDGQFIHRKAETSADGISIAKDTNNSTDDFEIIVHGQKSYPKK
ncbi:MAG: DUF4876 domain-containing protein [Prevotella sp.]|nr:DUF4876 domain-containing protein [Prevotella sp.]MBP3788398.1 DUF4876 domain-containing protein [Prevotella sp.]